MKNLLDYFYVWASKIRDEIAALGVQLDVVAGEETTNPAVRADFAASNRIGRITLWRSGDVHMEVLDVESGDTIFEKMDEIPAPADFDGKFFPFLELMRQRT